MTPTETTKLCTLSDKVLRDDDRRTDVVELAKLGRVAGKLIPEMRADRDAYRAQRDAIESAKDVVSRFAASLAGSVNGDEYAWTLEDMKRDATRWREATAAGAESDEALAKAAYDECHPHYPYRWGDVDGPGLSESADFVHVARVVRERVQAQCAAQLAEALDVHDVSWPEMLKMVEQEARAADQRVGMNGAEPPLLRRLDPEGAYDTEADFVSDFNEQREALANLMKYANLLDAPVIFDASALYRELGSKRAAAANAPRQPRPGEVWRSIPWAVDCVVGEKNQHGSVRMLPKANVGASCLGWTPDNADGWTFVRGPEAAEPTTPATLPPALDAAAYWARQYNDGAPVHVGDVARALAALVDCEMARRAVVGGSNG